MAPAQKYPSSPKEIGGQHWRRASDKRVTSYCSCIKFIMIINGLIDFANKV